ADSGLAALEPDLIGEHHVLRMATDALVDSCLDWAGPNVEKRRHVLTVLNRSTRAEHGDAKRHAHVQLSRLGENHASRLASDLIAVAIETPGQLLDLCSNLGSQIAELEAPVVDAIDAALPMHSVALMPLSLRVAERCVELARISVASVDTAELRLHEEA